MTYVLLAERRRVSAVDRMVSVRRRMRMGRMAVMSVMAMVSVMAVITMMAMSMTLMVVLRKSGTTDGDENELRAMTRVTIGPQKVETHQSDHGCRRLRNVGDKLTQKAHNSHFI